MENAVVDHDVPQIASTPKADPPTQAEKKAAISRALQLLPTFVEKALWNQRDPLSDIADEMASALEVSHPGVARKMRRLRTMKPTQLRAPSELIAFERGRRTFSEVILPDQLGRRCRDILAEHLRADDLAQFGLHPRHRVLLHGDPGNGKTMLAEAFSTEMDLPFLCVKYAGMVGSYLGETGKNLNQIFEYAAAGPCVLFLDEFDGIAVDRRDGNDVAEIRRVTNQLLIAIDRLPPSCMFIAATNLFVRLDSAVVRRFDFVLEIPTPTEETRLLCATKELDIALTPGKDVSHLARAVANLPLKSLSAVVDRCREIRRDLVLNDGRGIDELTRRPAD